MKCQSASGIVLTKCLFALWMLYGLLWNGVCGRWAIGFLVIYYYFSEVGWCFGLMTYTDGGE